MAMIASLLLAGLCHTIGASPIGPYVAPLTPEQVQRLKNWTEDEKENVWELSGQVEGDMILSASQRNGIIGAKYRWPNREIPYELAPVFSQEQADWIAMSLQAFTNYTCLTVRKRTNADVDYVYVTGEDTGCSAQVGRQGGKQRLNFQIYALGTGCFRPGTIVHEFLHAAGFRHQQCSSDRDNYVEIMWANIKAGSENNFKKYEADVITSYGEPYDYGSVMHYSAYSFSANGKKTIVTRDSTAEIGQRIGMSPSDAKKVNLMYECDI